MASPPPVIPVTANCGSHMRDPYGAGPPVSARHHANTERGCTGLLRSYIERSAGGIPHITANDWGSLGFAAGYTQSEDNICILARQYLKFGAQLSAYSPQDPLAWASDYFYQLLIDRGDAQAPVPQRLEEMFAGMAAGYNHYLAQTGVDNIPDPGCRGASWVKPTTALAVKRVSSVDYALDYMLKMISGAQPPPPEQVFRPELSAVNVAGALDAWLEVPRQGGSNAIAIGSDAAQDATALLVANPHMPWNEPFQRFYPMHHIIPGELNLLGGNRSVVPVRGGSQGLPNGD